MTEQRRTTQQGWDEYEAVVAAAYDREELMLEHDIPESVIDTLAAVREDGRVNMLDQSGVLYVANDLDCAPDAFMWIYNNKDRYVEALRLMGERRQAETGG